MVSNGRSGVVVGPGGDGYGLCLVEAKLYTSQVLTVAIGQILPTDGKTMLGKQA